MLSIPTLATIIYHSGLIQDPFLHSWPLARKHKRLIFSRTHEYARSFFIQLNQTVRALPLPRPYFQLPTDWAHKPPPNAASPRHMLRRWGCTRRTRYCSGRSQRGAAPRPLHRRFLHRTPRRGPWEGQLWPPGTAT